MSNKSDPLLATKLSDPETLKIFQWFNDAGYQADIPALQKLYPPLKMLEQWLRATGWENAEPLHMTAVAQLLDSML
jgi:hypothetical protein